MSTEADTSDTVVIGHTIPAALTDERRGGGEYPAYGYLWHLAAAGVVDLRPADDGDYHVEHAVWFDRRLRREPARIALIDTGLADHPNLEHAIVRDLSIDFGSHEGGAAYRGRNEKPDDFFRRLGVEGTAADRAWREPRGRLPGLADRAAVESLLTALAPDLPADRLRALVGELARRIGRGVVLRDITAQDQRYPSHGTASAGLLVGAPRFKKGPRPDEAEFDDSALPVFGVDPWSEVIPIATSFEPDPMQLTLALLYAVANGADVIHMPRGTDSPDHPQRPDPRMDHGGTRYVTNPDWDLFEAVLLAVSRRVPVVCAAGNSGDDRLGYPAALAAGADGRNGVIAVGAVTALGRRAGYSNYGPGLTLVAPSNDSRVYSRHQMRLDPRDKTAASHNWAIHDSLDGGYVEFSHQAPVTLDIPGARGFRGGVAAGPRDMESADYTLFGGTSAASAIVAGIAALMCRAMRTDRDRGERGLLIKRSLIEAASHTLDGRELLPDISNRDDPRSARELAALNFGAGLVNAAVAIDEVAQRP